MVYLVIITFEIIKYWNIGFNWRERHTASTVLHKIVKCIYWEHDSLKQNFLPYVSYKGLGKYSGGIVKCKNRKLTEKWQSKLASSAERNSVIKSHWLWKSFIPTWILALNLNILSLCTWLGCQKITLLSFVFLEGNCWKPFSSVKMHFDDYFSNPLSSVGPLHFFLGSGKFPLFSLSWILICLWHLAC